jgi:hypothetical protein
VLVKHTPGPWAERDCEVQTSDGSPICEMLARPEDTEKWGRNYADANSYLICAAPELLESLRGLCSLIESGEDNRKQLTHLASVARTVVTKAEKG